MSMLSLIGDPERLKGEYAKLDARRKEIEDATAIAATGDEIVAMRDQAMRDRAQASAELVDARDRAQVILDDAKARAAQIDAIAQEEAEKLRAYAKDALDEAQMKEQAAAETLTNADQQVKDALLHADAISTAAEEKMNSAGLAIAAARKAEKEFREARMRFETVAVLVNEALRVDSP